MKFKEFAILFQKALPEEELTIQDKYNIYFGRSLIRGALTFNDFIWADDPWEVKDTSGPNPKYLAADKQKPR